MADVTETFPDGTVIERDFTAEEIAQREKDAADSKAARIAAEKAAADASAAREAAVARFAKLGFTDAEIAILVPAAS